MATTPPALPGDSLASTPGSSGYFFHTLRQANANPEHTDNVGSTPVPSGPSQPSDPSDPGDPNDTDSGARPGTALSALCRPSSGATATVVGNAPSLFEKDPELGQAGVQEPAPAALAGAGALVRAPTSRGRFQGGAFGAATGADHHSVAALAAARPPPLPQAPDCCTSLALPSKDEQGWRRLVRNFAPSWFAVSMGTGIVSILLHNLPYNATWLWYLSIIVFCLNIVLFLFFSAVTVMRYVMYPRIWNVMIKHPSQSLFLGCIPIAFATLIKMMVLVCRSWGRGFIYLIWAFWWADVIVACASGLIIPFVVVHHHRNQLSSMTAALLLPVIPVVVASATGGLIAEILPDRGHAVTTLVTSYILWGLGEAFSFFIMTVYFLRLQIHDLPPREVIVSVFLPVGPLGQGGFAIQQLGKVAIKLLPETAAFNGVAIAQSPAALVASAQYGGAVLYMLGILGAFFLWGAAVGWLSFAVISIATTKSFPFNMGWWGFVFPLGVFTSCSNMLATELSSSFFRVLTMICSIVVFCLWFLVTAKTAIMVCHGDMLYAPCLRDLRPKDTAAGENRMV